MVNEWKRVKCESNACVEILENYGDVFIRSSRDPQHSISLHVEEWTQFLEAVKRGEFDS